MYRLTTLVLQASGDWGIDPLSCLRLESTTQAEI